MLVPLTPPSLHVRIISFSAKLASSQRPPSPSVRTSCMETPLLRRRINYQLGILTDSLHKRTVNRQLGRKREEVWFLKSVFCSRIRRRKRQPGLFDVAVMRPSASAVLVVLAVCLFGGAQCGEKYWWMDQGSELNILAFCSPILPMN